MRALAIAATGMSAQEQNLEVIANNVANINTTGFKRSRAEFTDLIYQTERLMGVSNRGRDATIPEGAQIGLGVRTAAIRSVNIQGALTNTGNTLDLAINGRGWFEVTTPNGDTVYTRDGAFNTNANGQLVTMDGYTVAPPILIPATATAINISQTGLVSATIPGQTTAQQLGQLTIANFVNEAGLQALGGNYFQQTAASGQPSVGVPGDTAFGILQQGYVEASNVDPMLEHLGLDVHGASLRNRNVASVIVTTDLAAGMEPGARLDVTVSALGDAPSLMGGTLLLTQLQSSNGVVYATAQGAVSVTGFETAGQGETLSQGVPTAGRIPNGAIVEHEVPAFPDELRSMLELKNPDYVTAVRIVDAINAYSRQRFRAHAAYEVDSRTVELFRPRNVSFARFMAEVGALQVDPDMAARVVLDARTGTVVVGQDVQISTVAVTYGTLTVRVAEQPRVSQPAPFSQGKTVVTPNTKIDVEQGGGPIAIVSGSSLRTLVSGLNRIGVKPPGIIAILQAIKTAGALQADLVIQ